MKRQLIIQPNVKKAGKRIPIKIKIEVDWTSDSSVSDKEILDDILYNSEYIASLIKTKYSSKTVLKNERERLLSTPVPKDYLSSTGLSNAITYGYSLRACNDAELRYYAFECRKATGSQLATNARRILQINRALSA